MRIHGSVRVPKSAKSGATRHLLKSERSQLRRGRARIRAGRYDMYIRYTSYSCSSCGNHLESRLVTSPRVGPENKYCSKCGHSYRTPDREWTEMTKCQRLGYFLSEWTIGWLLLFAAGGAAWSGDVWPGVLYGLLGGIICCTPSWLVKIRKVRQSRERASRDLISPIG